MREIKCRALLDSGKWIYVTLHPGHRKFEGGSDEYVGEAKLTTPWLQNTGLKDKNGKDIYEGDLIKFRLWEVSPGFEYDTDDEGYVVGKKDIPSDQRKYKEIESETYKVVFDNGMFRCLAKPNQHEMWLPSVAENQGEVVGNIFEHPEPVKA